VPIFGRRRCVPANIVNVVVVSLRSALYLHRVVCYYLHTKGDAYAVKSGN